jgi:hypothetical protein
LSGEQPAAQLSKITLPMFDPLSSLASLILSFREVRFDLLSVTQVIGDDSINIRQCRRRIPLKNRLWGCTILERPDDKF